MIHKPANSHDLSPIKQIWDVIGRYLKTLPLLRSEDELLQKVDREWRAIPQDAIRTQFDSVLIDLFAVHGGSKSY